MYRDKLPENVEKFLIQKEDRFFYYHPGVNPLSIVRASLRTVMGQRVGGASTITQQLVKNLLNHRTRSISNKIIESFYAFSLELFTTKQQILTMYANTVFMGNQVQGLHTASDLYFRKPLEELDDTKIAMLLATITSPSVRNPWREENATASRNLAIRLGIEFLPELAIVTDPHPYKPPRNLELESLDIPCATMCQTTIDSNLTDKLRSILARHVEKGQDAGITSGAIVVIKLPENELLSIIGTPFPEGLEKGQQINMAITPRAIGSTAKPLIYLAGFEKGLRPYTLVNDREFKFPIGTGYPLYPKNYDGKYRGWVTLHSSLSNSLNVPTVQVLQYIGLPQFYSFLIQSLGFQPLKDLDDYQYGIALGALEMDPLTLAHFTTIFPTEGVLRPLRLITHGPKQILTTPMSHTLTSKKIADPALTQLVTRVLNDRFRGVEQFGLASTLNLPQSNYAVKTGTSQDYHDSWTIGYTPDFLVVSWLGNPENKPLKQVTGQTGAGAVWHDVMQLLMNSEYDRETPLDFSLTSIVDIEGTTDFGLPEEVVGEHRSLLPDSQLISSPLDGDTFLLELNTNIPLVSSEDVTWYVNGARIGFGTRVIFAPERDGEHVIRATAEDGNKAEVKIYIRQRP
jgi:membrane peptidoglycan carboxypeptidase